MLNKYIIAFSDGYGKIRLESFFAGNEETAVKIFRSNFGPHPEAKVILLGEASPLEKEQ